MLAEKRPATAFEGLMINLLSRLEKSAVRPLTRTLSTIRPSKSSENDFRGFFALAVTVVFALISPELRKPRLIA
jgi:hypothetical protein